MLYSNKKIVKASLVSLIILLTAACQQETGNVKVAFNVPVTVAEVKQATIEDKIVTFGKLRAKQFASLTVKTPGLLNIAEKDDHILREGDQVQKGDLIATITDRDAGLTGIRKKAAKQKLISAQEHYESTKKWYEQRLITIDRYRSAKNAYEEAKVEFQVSSTTETQNQIRTPIDGVIIKLSQDEAGYVQSDQMVAQIAELDTLLVDVNLVSSDILKISPNLEARIVASSAPNTVFLGNVSRLAPALDEKTRTLKTEITLDNEAGLLKPGMFVEVGIVIEKRENAPVIQMHSVAERGGKKVVFVLNGQRVEQRSVELGIREGDLVEVRKGVKLGEKLVVLGLETLTDQMPVQVTEI